MNTLNIFRRAVLTALVAGLVLPGASHLAGQEGGGEGGIAFESDLPRTLVFITERGEGDVATRDFTRFLREAGFPLVDPALAHTAVQRDLVEHALEGDQGAAVELGRSFGAHVLILGRADWGARPDPVDGSLITATSEVEVRALRLDRGTVVADARADSREIEATEQAARTKAIRSAAGEILQQTSFVGQLMNDWEATEWEEQAYWKPDPGSVQAESEKSQQASTGGSGSGSAPGLAILQADVQPSTQGNTRGLGVVKKGDRSSSLFNPVRLEGVVVGSADDVRVEGKEAMIEPLSPEEAKRLGLAGLEANRFWAEMSLPMSQDTVTVQARGRGGAVSKAVAAPRIDERWAVVIGISQYQSQDIPDLEYADRDAQAIKDFLTSSAAGPFEEDHVLYLTNEDATASRMREALFVFLQQADWDDLVVIYYAGHGAPDPNRPDNLYLLPYDSDLSQLAATAFPMWDVKTALRRQIQAERVVVIADACHSAGTTESAVGGQDNNNIAGGFTQLFTPSRRLTLTAAASNEFSVEDARWNNHGVFTYFLLEGLRGQGDADGNGIVTFTEAYEYVYDNVRDATNGRQNPQRAGLGDVPLAAVEEAQAGQQEQDRPENQEP